jgi:hypothetical protein
VKPLPATSENYRYERLLHFHGRTFSRLGYKLCNPLPGWSGWDSWFLLHRATGRIRPAPPPRRLEKIIERIEARWRRRGY